MVRFSHSFIAQRTQEIEGLMLLRSSLRFDINIVSRDSVFI